MTVVLHQFNYSHFNEKVRWALAFKGIDHHRVSYLPGPHMGPIKKLSGQPQTPVAELDGQVYAGSAAIIAQLEERYPQPPLLPVSGQDRERVLTLQADMDQLLGPATRSILFSVLIHELGYLSRMFAKDKSGLKRGLYRCSLPLVRPLMAKGNAVDSVEAVAAAEQTTRTYLDRIADQSQATGYLVGETFTLADLTAASLIAPLASLQHEDMKRPQPMPETLQSFYRNWSEHPAVAWVSEIYARHR